VSGISKQVEPGRNAADDRDGDDEEWIANIEINVRRKKSTHRIGVAYDINKLSFDGQ
jgi:hypothetical protein